uniref:START domain-containing protein n=1 Tax=Kalanchoe fedtschenkoi TaxID=63787 RepID=A0A7N0U4G3_KALFE
MGMYPRHFQEPTMGNCSSMIMPQHLLPENNLHFNEGVMIMEEEKQLALELAMSSMDELVKMCRVGQPLWCQCKETGREVLNVHEYANMFPWTINDKNGVKQNLGELTRTEATRESSVVIMNSITLVDAFMDCTKWVDLFSSIIARARTIQVITSGVSGHANGSLQLMHAEYLFLSPLVPTRESYFLRYCQQNAEEGTWVVVDFPTDNFQNSFQSAHLPAYKRRPSGCIIQDMPNGYSRVTWVEHCEIEDKPVHQIFNNIVSNGLAFGAERWLNVLQRQCERLASLMARNIPDLGVIPSPEARKNLMKLAYRMIRTFCFNISTSNGQSWTALSDSSDDTIRITTRKVMEPGQPNGVILSAVSTTWLPHSHFQVFDLLRDEHKRAQIDVLSNGNSLHEVAHIANGSHPGNCISLLRINVASNSSQNVELMLQESCIDQSGCLIVHANVDVDSIQLAMSGEDPSRIPLLPIGFVITPVDPTLSRTSPSAHANKDANPANSPNPETKSNPGGCLLTVGLQVLASSLPSVKLSLSSITAINNHLCNMVHQIGLALGAGTVSNDAPLAVASTSGEAAAGETKVTADQA